MPGPEQQLLDAAIRYLEELRASGAAFVPLEKGILEALSAPARKAVAAPASPRVAAVPPRPQPVPSSLFPVPSAPAPVLPGIAAPEAAAFAAPELSREAKASAMTELRERALICQKCPHLAVSRKNVVFGVGDIYSPLMFVGEAPGMDEDTQGEPFVGKAGQLLTKIIQTMGLSRQTVYIANILKCRPDTPGQTSGNRKPTLNEMQTCLPYLLSQIDIIRPKIMVALGATAVEGLFGKPLSITRARGKFLSFRGIPVMPTYHPAYLLRNQALSVKREIWEDMLQVMEKLEMPVSEKQKNYFLKAG